MKYEIDKEAEKTTDWADRVLILWEEDDSPGARYTDGHVTGALAFKRFSGLILMENKCLLSHGEDSDYSLHLHAYGWVYISSCEGAKVGVVIK